ncbi:MAG: hypothetical protein KJ884_12455 [Gammaproteobacteria bacterium]|nr:hypothetical protein [Gammaproteobacteria bacterium]MBU1488953.1 hypothetical protein [Gammaproteobacteria bacterium]MBU2065519.1 hypothetical protein [Gammaproteobacteria bacterium]MBU2140447.1 hypothetical protein [Gammaproteobacteria bacterium]MBU2253669.1 hypothetical protein [Gammaproteobacteria bacterium]
MDLTYSWNKLKARLTGAPIPSRAEIAERLALQMREKCSATTFIGITGSGAKSSTSAFLHHLLSSQGTCALSLFENTRESIVRRMRYLTPQDRYAIFEISGHAPGAIDDSCRFVRPDLAILTLVSQDHYSNHRSLDATAAEKSRLAHAAFANGGTVFINLDDPLLAPIAALAPGQSVTYGEHPDATYRALNVRNSEQGRLLFDCLHDGKSTAFDIGFLGRHFIVSALAAIACAHHQGQPMDVLASRAARYQQLEGRCSLHTLPDQRLYACDTVKAPFATLELAFALTRLFPAASRRTIVLGKLSDYPGAQSPRVNQAYRLARQYADRVIFFGELESRIKASDEDLAQGRVLRATTLEALDTLLQETAMPGEVIVLKGSGKVDKLQQIVPRSVQANETQEPLHGLYRAPDTFSR